MPQDIKALCDHLTSKYHWQRIDPTLANDTDNLRYLVACIATSGDAENRVMSFLHQLGDVWSLDQSTVEGLLERNGIKYAQRKALFIVNAVNQVRYQHNGRLPMDRAQLEALPGVGRHIASVVLATLGDRDEFAVDYHVRRVFKRLGINPTSDTDQAYERLVTQHVDSGLWGHFSRALVDFGQDICGHQPRCNLCALDCPSRRQDDSVQGAQRQRFETVMVQGRNGSYAVTIRSGRLTCTCQGYRFRLRCRHVEAVEQVMHQHTEDFYQITI
jgi:endonuclease III